MGARPPFSDMKMSLARDGSFLTETRRWLRRHGLRARKSLGQNFLVDAGVLDSIIDAAGLTREDTVFEVGPGPGFLTRELADAAGRVAAVELDDNLAGILTKDLADYANTIIINRNILDIGPDALLQELDSRLGPAEKRYKVVANLPYYITSPVLRHFLEATLKPETMVIMVQKEVAETIVAGAGKRSLLSISVQFYGEPRLIRYVPADAFFPVPEVDSAILKIDVYPAPAVPVSDETGFFNLVRAGFTASRKQVLNSLAQGLQMPKDEIRNLLDRAGIEPSRRAETFTLEEWARLWGEFNQEK